jgi:WD40 repeat protein
VATQPIARLVTAMTWLPDGRIAVAANKVEFVDPTSGAVVERLMDTTPIADMACTRDGRLLATADANKTATIYHLDAPGGPGSRPTQLGPHAGRVYAVAFAPDGALLATAGANDALVHLWDVASGAEIGQFPSDGGDIRTLAFTADGKALVGGGTDPAALMWALPPAATPPGR